MEKGTVMLTIPGKPVGKGRPRFGNGFTYTPKKTVEYENLVRLAWINSGAEMLHGAIAATICAHFPMPTSWSKKKKSQKNEYTHKPDVDNICKIILDPLNGLAYQDDSQVVSVSVCKLYTQNEPKVVVTLSEKGDEDGR